LTRPAPHALTDGTSFDAVEATFSVDPPKRRHPDQDPGGMVDAQAHGTASVRGGGLGTMSTGAMGLEAASCAPTC